MIIFKIIKIYGHTFYYFYARLSELVTLSKHHAVPLTDDDSFNVKWDSEYHRPIIQQRFVMFANTLAVCARLQTY